MAKVKNLWFFAFFAVSVALCACARPAVWLLGGPAMVGTPRSVPLTLNESALLEIVNEQETEIPEAERPVYLVYPERMTTAFLAAYIASVNPSRKDNQLSNEELARKILIVAEEFGIDPFVFAALIRKESTFRRRALSPTGAIGLTQMTTIAIHEVNRQLGVPGRRYLITDIGHFQDNVANGRLAQRLGYGEWVPLWIRGQSIPEMKQALVNDPDTSLLYGAVLMRTLLYALSVRYPQSTLNQRYRWALRRYNGDTLEREAYQRQIMIWAKHLRNRWKDWVNHNDLLVGPPRLAMGGTMSSAKYSEL